MNTEILSKPAITVAHILTTLGLIGGVLAYANDTENKVVENEARQGMIIRQQEVLREELKDYQQEQRAIQTQQMQLLHEIKGKLEAD